MKGLLRGGLVLLVLFLIVLGLFGYALSTQSGLLRLLGLGQSHTAGELQWQSASGRVLGPLKLEQVSYVEDSGLQVAVGRAELDWQPSSLLDRTLQLDKLTLDQLEIRLPAADQTAPAASADAALQLRDFTLPIAANINDVLITNLSIYPAGQQDPLLIDRIELTASGAQQRVKLVNLALAAPAAQATLRGEVDTAGRWPTTLELSWSYLDEQLGELRGKGSMLGNVDEMVFEHQLDGAVQATSSLVLTDLLDAPGWQGTVAAQLADAGVLAPALASVPVELRLQTNGSVSADGTNFNARVHGLEGAFNRQPLTSSGSIEWLTNELQFRGFKLNIEESALALAGSAGQQLALDWQLQLPELTQLLPAAAGRFVGTGKLAGTPTAPAVTAQLDASELAFEDIAVGALGGEVAVDLSSGQQLELNLQAQAVALAGQQWDSLQLQASGQPEDSRINLALSGADGQFSALLNGGWKDQRWRGTLDEFSARQTVLGDWLLSDPAPLQAGPQQAQAQDLCLTSEPAQVCVNGSWDAQSGVVASSSIKRFPVDRMAQFLPPQLQFDQFINADLVATVAADGKPLVEVNMDVPAAHLSYRADGQSIRRKLGASRVAATLDDDKLDVKADVSLGKLGQAQLVAAIADLYNARELTASALGALDDLTLVSLFAPDIQAIEGTVEFDLSVSGTLDEPVPDGRIQLKRFAAEIPQVAVKLSDGKLRAERRDGVFRIVGSARSGEGDLRIEGDADPLTRALQLRVSGERFQVANSRNMRAVVSPDITIKLDEKGTKVRGSLNIPSAYVKSGGSSGTVKVSSDVVIIDETDTAPAAPPTAGIDLGMQVTLGDDVRVEAGDFEGSISGNLGIEQRPGRVVTGSGTIEVTNGDYIIYGQKLTMERGRILFGGGPLDDPQLDMDVLRDVPAYEVRAGARIRGTAKLPVLELYSEPVLTDANILSYIVLGQPMGTRGGSYTLGKFITPELYVSYGIGLFDAVNTFSLRYKLNDRLTLQAASGTNSSADLVYTLER